VILCRRGKAEEALQQLRKIMSKLKLTVNEEKTRICKVPEGEFDFLGYTFGRMYSARTGQARLGYRPSKKSNKRMVEKIYALTNRTGTWGMQGIDRDADIRSSDDATEAREQLERYVSLRDAHVRTIAGWRRMAYSEDPAYLALRERIYEGLRKAGMTEQ
jgi:hypothetical protein